MNRKEKGSKRRFGTAVLALMLVLGLILSGCTGKQGSGTGTSEAPSGITAAADETETAAETEQETESSETETEASAADSSETPGDTESTGEDDFWQEIHDTFDDFAEKDFEGTDVDGGFLRTGQFPEADLVKPEVLGDPELAEMDRAMRAYRAKGDPEIINNAPGFFYYDHFDDGKRAIYDALYELAQDPTTTDHIVALKTDRDIQSDEFEQDFYTVWMAIACDHPELWWMYLWNGEVAFDAYVGEESDTLYFRFTKPYENFEEDLQTFNEVTQDIIDSIDPEQTDEEILREVHDIIINMCTYDFDTLNENRCDFAHTAYGAFIANSLGQEHYCVCDGYSMAYLYILQQLGFYGTCVYGWVSNAGSGGSVGGHTWSVIQADGIWYEIDSTWDDYTNLPEMAEAGYGKDSVQYQLYCEIASDEEFMDRLLHYLFMITTEEMNHYEPSDDLVYYSKDGQYRVSMVSATERVRCDDDPSTADVFQGMMAAYVPEADGEMHNDAFFRREPSEEPTEDETENTDEPDESSTEEDDTESETEPVPDSTEADTGIEGIYYVSSRNGYSEQDLIKKYGEEYYVDLPMFELLPDGTGTLSDGERITPFRYVFEADNLFIRSERGRQLMLVYRDGNFILQSMWGKTSYVLSKMK